MKTYLKYVNPVMALLVFGLCTYASAKEEADKALSLGVTFGGGIPTYLFAKGIFCSLALLILGKVLERLPEK